MSRLPVRSCTTGALSKWIGIAGFFASPMFLAGCAGQSYMGISLVPGQAPVELQSLAQRAQAGDKLAQLELGRQYEQGAKVPINVKRALRLYRLAAMDSASPLWIYAPSPGRGAPGRLVAINSGPMHAGLEAARKSLERLEKINHGQQ